MVKGFFFGTEEVSFITRLLTKGMRNCFIYAIPCYAEFRNSAIPTVGNLTEINLISKPPKLRGNVTEILTEMLNRNS